MIDGDGDVDMDIDIFWIYTTHIYTYDIENEIKLYSIYYDGTFIHAHTHTIYIYTCIFNYGRKILVTTGI